MVNMNIFDSEFSMKSFNNNIVPPPHNFNKELCSFDFMFNTNTYSYNHFKPEEADHGKVNNFGNANSNHISTDFIGNSLMHQSLGNAVRSESSSFQNNNIFDTMHFKSDSQSWNTERQWSNGDVPLPTVPLPTVPLPTVNSFMNNSPLGSSPVSASLESGNFGGGMGSNNLLSSSPCIPSQSRIMSYINNSTPPLPSSSTSPNLSHSNTGMPAKIEAMKIKDFLHRPSSNGSPGFDGPSSLPHEPFMMEDISKEENQYSFSYSPQDGSDSFFSNFLHGSFNSISLNDEKNLIDSNFPADKSVNVWDSLHNISVDLSTSAPSNLSSKNAWSKPLKFDKKSLEATDLGTPKFDREPIRQASTPAPVKLEELPLKASVGRKVSELDDFETAVPIKKHPVKNNQSKSGDFQVVCNKKNKVAKLPKASPPPGLEKCSYGSRCLFGIECSRWHSPDDHDAFNRQKLPNGARKCPWGSKCFRKLKCINYHSDRDLEQFKKELSQ